MAKAPVKIDARKKWSWVTAGILSITLFAYGLQAGWPRWALVLTGIFAVPSLLLCMLIYY